MIKYTNQMGYVGKNPPFVCFKCNLDRPLAPVQLDTKEKTDSDSPFTLFPPFAVLIGLHQSSSWAFSFLVNFPCNTFHMSICLLSPPHVSLPQTPVWKCLQNSPQISWQTLKQNTVPSQSLCFGNCVSLVSIASFLFDYLHLLNVVSQHFTTAIFHQMERKEGLWCCLWKWEWEKCQEWPSPQTFKFYEFMYAKGSLHLMSRRKPCGGCRCHWRTQAGCLGGGIGDWEWEAGWGCWSEACQAPTALTTLCSDMWG